jgi:Domain of unknown function (DUF4203)
MIPALYATPATLVLAAGGLLSCFFGYRLFRFVLGLYGFYAGALVTTSIMAPSNMWALVLAAIVGGIVGATLMVAAYFVGVGLVGAGLAALAINVAWRFIGGDPPTAVLVIGCVLGALGALSLVRYVVIFGTALAGSWTMLVAGLALMGNSLAARAASSGDVWIFYPLDAQTRRWWTLPLWLGVACLGVAVQLSMTKAKNNFKKRKTGV